ncbi:MAG: family 43 glycosylhydrolase [Bacteroidaceae bacterium]|nr:family 43 glycosylhydrolase [Bacteroidaceae bacterium]
MRTKRLLLTCLASGFIMLCAEAQTYTNPVYGSDFPDPSVQRAPDGYFYSYATGQRGLRSKDLMRWSKLNNVIPRPTWNDTSTDSYSFWACDVNYVDGKYLMYYACALWGNGTRTGIGVATGDTPDKFTDRGKLFRSSEIGVTNSIDPCYVEEFDKKYLVWGSFHDIYVAELTDDGLSVKNFNQKTKIGGGAFEGVMIHKHKNYYYMFASVGSCCEGLNSTYRTVVGRSTNLKGPYVNRNGGTMFDNNYTTIIKGNNRFKGPGHNSEIITDDNGDDWILYHSYDANNGGNGRLLLLDKIVWDANGWPTVNDGTPSTTPQVGPVFYTGDGQNLTYRFRDLDFMHRNFRNWKHEESDDCTAMTGQGTPFMPLLSAKGGEFHVHQDTTGLKDGIYELRLNDYTRGKVKIYLNDIEDDAIYNARASVSAATASTDFITGRYSQSVYGMVANGKLSIGMHTTEPMGSTTRFYAGGLQIIYREKNAEICQQLLPRYAHLADSIAEVDGLFYQGYRTSLKKYVEESKDVEDADARYKLLHAMAATLDSIRSSTLYYDSLRSELAKLSDELAYAEQHGVEHAASSTIFQEAEVVLKDPTYTDKQVLDLISRVRKATEEQAKTFQRGDGTAENPYVIIRPEQLEHMHDVLVQDQMTYFELGADIDMEGYEWKQLNTSSNKYRYFINFNGKGHLIENLTPVDASGYPSFFGTLCGECRNVGFVNAKVTSTNAGAGILAGFIGNGSFKDAEGNLLTSVVENCYFTGNISSKGYVGVIGGYLNYSPVIIRNVYTNVEINGTGASANYVGGIVGRVRSNLTLQNSYAAGNVNGPVAGGIVAGGQTNETPAAVYENVIAWNQVISGNSASAFGTVTENDQLNETYILDGMLLNDVAQEGKTHEELQQIAAKWGAPWYADPTAGNGYPILQWQYDRGDYKQKCGFPIIDGIDDLVKESAASDKTFYYDLMGRRVETPVRGIYVEIRNGKARKVLME